MSLYEQAIEEWKQQDPYLENFEGFQRFLEEKEKQKAESDAWQEREEYCTKKLKDLVIKAVLIREFGDVEVSPVCTWEDFYEMAHRWVQIDNGLGDWLPFDSFGVGKIKHTLNITVSPKFAYDYWRENIAHPEWFGDWDVAFGAKGYCGDGYRLRMWLAICVKLGVGAEALEILNNLPEEMRRKGIPDHIKEYVEHEAWKETYKEYCKDCKRDTCEGCVPYVPEIRQHES